MDEQSRVVGVGDAREHAEDLPVPGRGQPAGVVDDHDGYVGVVVGVQDGQGRGGEVDLFGLRLVL